MVGDPFNPVGASGHNGQRDSDPMARTVIVPRPSNAIGGETQPSQNLAKSKRIPGVNIAVPRSGSAFDLSAYPNPLLRAAGPLVFSAIQLKDTLGNSDPNAVRKRMSKEMRAFDKNAKNFGVSIAQTNAARYVLCTFIDEIVMSTPWGVSSGWSERSLLSEFYGETFGGEKVFTVIDRALRTPSQHQQLLELAYIILSLGYEGKYRVRNGGRLKEVQANIFNALRHERPPIETTLSPHWRGEEENRTDRFMKIVPLWLIALIGVAVLGFLYTAYSLALNDVREPVYRITQSIEQEGEDLIALAPAPSVEAFDLEARLFPFVGDGLEVRTEQGVATVSLLGTQGDLPLFRSGSARLHQRAVPMLTKVADVLSELETDATVTGHTDSQGRIGSNQRLSELRARSVTGELVHLKVERDRIESRGFGSNAPAVSPERTEADRAANRRVEIRFRVPDVEVISLPSDSEEVFTRENEEVDR